MKPDNQPPAETQNLESPDLAPTVLPSTPPDAPEAAAPADRWSLPERLDRLGIRDARFMRRPGETDDTGDEIVIGENGPIVDGNACPAFDLIARLETRVAQLEERSPDTLRRAQERCTELVLENRRLRRQAQAEWISVADRLPPPGLVLAYGTASWVSGDTYFISRYLGEGKGWFGDVEVTHWAPLMDRPSPQKTPSSA